MKLEVLKSKIGIEIQNARNNKNLSREKLAKMSETNPETIRTIENGTANWTIDKISKISKKLGVKIFVAEK